MLGRSCKRHAISKPTDTQQMCYVVHRRKQGTLSTKAQFHGQAAWRDLSKMLRLRLVRLQDRLHDTRTF